MVLPVKHSVFYSSGALRVHQSCKRLLFLLWVLCGAAQGSPTEDAVILLHKYCRGPGAAPHAVKGVKIGLRVFWVLKWWKWRKMQGKGNLEGYIVLLLHYIYPAVKADLHFASYPGRLWINICFTSLAGLIHSNADSHKQTERKKEKNKYTLRSAGYHISKPSEPGGPETSDLLCSNVTPGNANQTPTAEKSRGSHHPGLKRARTHIPSVRLDPPKLLEIRVKLLEAEVLQDSAPASQLLQSCAALGTWRHLHQGQGEDRQLLLSSRNFGSSKEVPRGWQRMRVLAEGLPLKHPLPCGCLPLLCTLEAVTSPVPAHNTLHSQH